MRKNKAQCEFDFNDKKEMYWNNYRKSFTVIIIMETFLLHVQNLLPLKITGLVP